MTIISDEQVRSLGITAAQCVEWVRESFCMKDEAQLPPKCSVHPQGSDFFNTMPCVLPAQHNRFGVKIVSRIAGRVPSLHSDLLLYEATTGNLLCMMDADWITQMRTGAVAALAIETLKKTGGDCFAFAGLGSTAKAAMKCLLAITGQEHLYVKLLRYKNQAETFAAEIKDERLTYQIVDSHNELVEGSDVIVSAVTEMAELFCPDNSLFKEGVLVVPVHTRGFQNCDLFFDQVFGDDRGHVSGFRYFSQFRTFHEFSEVLTGKVCGRRSDSERILAYNIGIGLHDVWFATKIYERLCSKNIGQIGFV